VGAVGASDDDDDGNDDAYAANEEPDEANIAGAGRSDGVNGNLSALGA